MSASPATDTRTATTSLAVLAATAVMAVLIVSIASQPRIDAAQERLRAHRLQAVLPGFDASASDIITHHTAGFDDDAPLPAQRLWHDGAPYAAVLQVIAPDGYNGGIVLLVGITIDGQITGVRVLSHRETPGLGDDIERRRSDWITHFEGLALGNPPEAEWSVRKPGGRFDAFTGATITPQAVVGAVHDALRWFDQHSSTLFSLPRQVE